MEKQFTHKVEAFNDVFGTTVFYGTKSECHRFVSENEGMVVSGVESELEVVRIKQESEVAYARQLRGHNFYYKLWASLNKSLSDEELKVHSNMIVVELAKSIESQANYYNPTMDAWCEEFLK